MGSRHLLRRLFQQGTGLDRPDVNPRGGLRETATSITISELAKHELDDREFYRKVQESLKIGGDVEVDVMVFFKGTTEIDFSKSFEDQIKTKATAIVGTADLREQ